MGSRVPALLLLGIIIGSGIGYIGSTILPVTNPRTDDLERVIQDLTQSNQDLNQKYTEAKVRLDSLNATYNKLKTEYDQLLQLAGSSTSGPNSTTTTESLTRTYTWSYDNREWTVTLAIPASLYDYYRGLQRPQTDNYSVYVTHPLDDDYLKTVIEKFNMIAALKGYTEAQKVNLVISFIQSLPYTLDTVTTAYDEYPRYPLETLVDEGGDCEDTSILTASLLTLMNYNTVMLRLPNHMAVGVELLNAYGTYYTYNGINYYYLETTGENWKIGEIPDEYKSLSATIIEIKPIPILIHAWDAKRFLFTMTLTVNVKNIGTATAYGYLVKAGFDAGNDQWVNVESSPVFDLAPSYETTITLKLTVPKNRYTRVIVEIVAPDGYYTDISYSDWFNT